MSAWMSEYFATLDSMIHRKSYVHFLCVKSMTRKQQPTRFEHGNLAPIGGVWPTVILSNALVCTPATMETAGCV